jgi:hypothetical protein
MVKKLLTGCHFAFVFILGFSANAQTKHYKFADQQPGIQKHLVSSNIKTSTIKFTIGDYALNELKINAQSAYIPQLNGATPILKQGAPELLKITSSIIIPNESEMQVKVISFQFTDYNNILIAPSKGNIKRDQNPNQIPYNFGDSYQKNAFFPGVLAELREPYILREHRGQTIVINPFQYNPVTKTLRVYSEITVEVAEKNGRGLKTIQGINNGQKTSREFVNIYKSHFLNASSVSRYTPLEEGDKMLIIAHGPFMQAMQPFIQWKKQKGLTVEIIDVASIGVNPSAIKNFVSNYYNNNGLTYLLIVGDAAQIPPLNLPSGHSDMAYGYIVGNDAYPEIFVGRFSAESVADVNTQVQRVIDYEKNASGAWLKTAMGIASEEGPGYNNLYDFQHIRAIQNNLLLPYNYTTAHEMYEGSKGGNDAAGHPNANMIKNAVESGVGVINYTGHGWDYGWATSSFDNANVNALTNNGKLPFIWSVACVNGNFVGRTCFAEAWMRATNNNQPSGAIGVFMSTINQSWNPPMCAQDEFNKILSQAYITNQKRTFGGISINGCMRMNDEFGSAGTEMTDTWTLFGDPSLEVRTNTPTPMVVSHQPSTPVGVSSLQVNSNTEGATVALTLNGNLIGKGNINGGLANISFAPISVIDTIFVTVTAYNKTPYFGNVLIIAPNGPFVLNTAYTINDNAGNGNGKADFNETMYLDFTLNNFGNLTAQNVSATISSTDPYITILNDNSTWGNINAGLAVAKPNAFMIKTAGFVPNGHLANFSIHITDANSNTWNSTFSIEISAPALSAGAQLAKDLNGNIDKKLKNGAKAVIEIPVLNLGGSNVIPSAQLITSCPYITILSPAFNLPAILPGNSTLANFNIEISANTPNGALAAFTFTAGAGQYTTNKNFILRLNQNIEDFESNNFSLNNWQFAGEKPWVISDISPFEGSYSSKSGAIVDSQKSEMKITLNVENNDSIIFYRKVSSEEDYDFLYFYIDNTIKGKWSGNLPWMRESFAVNAGLRNFRWVYEKDNMVSSYSDCAFVDEITLPAEKSNPLFINHKNIIETEFKFFPNPAKNSINILYRTLNESTVKLTLTNIVGQEIAVIDEKEQTIEVQNVIFNTSYLNPGIYLLNLHTNNEIKTLKLVISN